MICDNCGTSLSETVNFCHGCGATVAPRGGQKGPTDYDFDNRAPNRDGQSPVTALFTDPAPTPTLPAVPCITHPAKTAAGVCVGCGSFYCRECLVASDGRNYCRNCSARLKAAPARQTQGLQYQPHNPAFSQPTAPQHYQPPQPPFMPQPGYPYAPPVVPYIRRKEPGIALLLSFLVPGVGQIYNGDVGKGIAFMLGFFLLVWFVIGWGFWIWAMVDAYQSATNINLGRRA